MIAFDPNMIPPVEADDGQPKRAKRDSLLLLTTLSDESGAARGKARVRNLSETGMMADCQLPLNEGERLVVHLRGIGAVSGCITWVRGSRIGMAFDKRIDPQAARKPTGSPTNESMPAYLRPVPRVARFKS